MEEKETKVAKRYSLILDIIPREGNSVSYNYYEFMKYFNSDSAQLVDVKLPLAAIDRFTTKYASEEEFNQIHRDFLSADYCYSQFILLTSLNPNDCDFNLHIEYKAHYNSDFKQGTEIKRLDPVFGDNEYLVHFLENNFSNIKSEYGWNQVMWFVLEFYRRIIDNEEFYKFALERISGLHRHNRYTDRDSRLINQIKACKVGAEENGEKYSVTKLEKLKRYKSFRAATMVMTEYEKTKTSEYYYENRHR